MGHRILTARPSGAAGAEGWRSRDSRDGVGRVAGPKGAAAYLSLETADGRLAGWFGARTWSGKVLDCCPILRDPGPAVEDEERRQPFPFHVGVKSCL